MFILYKSLSINLNTVTRVYFDEENRIVRFYFNTIENDYFNFLTKKEFETFVKYFNSLTKMQDFNEILQENSKKLPDTYNPGNK